MKQKVNKLIYILFFMSLFGCRVDISKDLKRAWINNDTAYLYQYLDKMEKLDTDIFYSELMDLNLAFNFSYGNLDLKDVENWSEKDKKIVKQNILIVYREYLNSCLFYEKELAYDSLLYYTQNFKTQEFYNAPFSIEDMADFKNEFQKYCKK